MKYYANYYSLNAAAYGLINKVNEAGGNLEAMTLETYDVNGMNHYTLKDADFGWSLTLKQFEDKDAQLLVVIEMEGISVKQFKAVSEHYCHLETEPVVE